MGRPLSHPRPGATRNWVRFARKRPNASDITPLKPRVSGGFRLASFCTFSTIAWLEPRAVRSIRREPSTFARRQGCASPSYPAIPQTLRDRQVGQNGLLVSNTPSRRAPPFRFGGARACFSHRIAKDSSHYPDIFNDRRRG